MKILKTLDNPLRILFWDLSAFLMLVVPIFVGMACGSFLLMCSGLALKSIYTKIRRKYPHNSLMHRLYWHLPKSVFERSGKLKQIPPSHVREYLL